MIKDRQQDLFLFTTHTLAKDCACLKGTGFGVKTLKQFEFE